MAGLPRHFFTADTLFGDETAARTREFDSADEMDAALTDSWNNTVGERDLVWIMGNFATAGWPPQAGRVRALNGAKYLVAGELDPVFAANALDEKRLANRVGFYREIGFAGVITGSGMAKKTGRPLTVPLRGWSDLDHPQVILSHFPYDLTESERGELDLFARWRPKRPRADVPWLLHGHQAEWGVRRSQVNVGMDRWGFVPVDAELVVALIEDGADVA